MLIYTPSRQLHVLQILRKTDETVTYICTDLAEEISQHYILNGYLEIQRCQTLIPLIIKNQNDFFTDFADYFSSDGVFYMLFRYHQGDIVDEKVANDSMESRLEYVRRILERIILQSIPQVFQYDILRPERVLITPRSKVRFLYMPEVSFGEKNITFSDVEKRIADLIEIILMQEISMQYSLELIDLVRDLRTGGFYKDISQLYIKYTDIQQTLLSQKDDLVSHKMKFQIWEKVKKVFSVFRYVAAFIIIVAAILLAGYQFFYTKEEKTEDTSITQIGTQIIIENQTATLRSYEEKQHSEEAR